MYRVYIGYDSREPKSYKVCEYSILKNTKNKDIKVLPLKQQELRDEGIYSRPKDELASTEFSFTRFLVPHLTSHKGFAIFMDSDMLITRDIMEVFDKVDKTKAVSVVKHNYVPKATIKMDNQVQRNFPKKNWSSFIVYNCEHPYNKQLTAKLVNEGAPKFLHCFEWLTKFDIGELPIEFNFLIGEYDQPTELPFNLHWTLGSPELLGNDVPYADIWNQYYEEATRPTVDYIPDHAITLEPSPTCPQQAYTIEVGPQRIQPSSVAKINAETSVLNSQLKLSEKEQEDANKLKLEKEYNLVKKN